jgi:NADH-quinone oxidoreductase subunit M
VYQKSWNRAYLVSCKNGIVQCYSLAIAIGAIVAAKNICIFMGLGIAGVIYGSIGIETKDLKKLLAYSSLAHVGLIAAGTYTLTLDGLRGAVYK